MRLALAATILLALPTPLLAQQWTPDQRQVLEDLERCWDAWSQAEQQKNYALWSDGCLASPDARFWWTAESTPTSSRDWNRGLSRGLFDWGVKRSDWQSIRPVAITIDGEHAFMYYVVSWVSENMQGQVTTQEQRRFEVFRRDAGRWKYLEGMASPSSGGGS